LPKKKIEGENCIVFFVVKSYPVCGGFLEGTEA
jgi:hypothetical protein